MFDYVGKSGDSPSIGLGRVASRYMVTNESSKARVCSKNRIWLGVALVGSQGWIKSISRILAIS